MSYFKFPIKLLHNCTYKVYSKLYLESRKDTKSRKEGAYKVEWVGDIICTKQWRRKCHCGGGYSWPGTPLRRGVTARRGSPTTVHHIVWTWSGACVTDDGREENWSNKCLDKELRYVIVEGDTSESRTCNGQRQHGNTGIRPHCFPKPTCGLTRQHTAQHERLPDCFFNVYTVIDCSSQTSGEIKLVLGLKPRRSN